MSSLIPYHGGKGSNLSKKILEFFPEHKIYLEPFGGAGNILFKKTPSPSEIYNDLENNIVSLMKVLWDKNLFIEFKEKCELALYSRKINEEFKERLITDNTLTVVERAFMFYYVARTSYNGNGSFSVTANYIRRNTSKSISDFLSSIDNLDHIHARLSNVIIENQNALKLIPKYDNDNVFIFNDPPYVQTTRSSDIRYIVDMDNKTQKEFIDLMLSMTKAKIMICGYDNKEYNRLCQAGWKREDIIVQKNLGNNKKKEHVESLWMNYSL